MTKKEAAQAEGVSVLKSWGLVPLTVVHAKVARVSNSGMSRRIRLYMIMPCKDGNNIVDITYWAAKALGWSYKEGYNNGISVGGCGMDMMFHTVDCLSRAMGYKDLNQHNGEVKEGQYSYERGLIYKQL